MKRTALLFIFICLIFALCGCGQSQINALEPEPTPELSVKLLASQREDTPDSALPQFTTEEHVPYLFPDEKNRISPDEPITRAEACAALYALLQNPLQGSCSFTDVSETDSLYPALCSLCAWGVISDSDSFNPDGLLSRAQLVTMLSAFYPPASEAEAPYVGSFLRRSGEVDRLPDITIPSFTDIRGHWAEAYIENAVTRGWIDPGGKFYPDGSISRGEFCHFLNTVLSRSCDTAVTVLTDEYDLFTDLTADSKYYGDILEAACTHDFYYDENGVECWCSEALEPGFHRAGGKLYYVQEDGSLLRSAQLEQWYFDEHGCYTTGLEELDDTITAILTELGTDDMSDEDALRAAYLYCTHDHVYIYHKASTYGFDGVRSEFAFRALLFFKAGGGYCYDYAAGFGLLARSLGYNCYIVKAQVNEYHAPHGFVVIPEDGVDYIYDTELESVRSYRHSDFALFRLRNYKIYDYWYDPWW